MCLPLRTETNTLEKNQITSRLKNYLQALRNDIVFM